MTDRVRAPELDRPGLEWVNIATPLSLEKLRGKYVILDFWTSCCINCLHVLPTLKRIEQEFPGDVVVIGVHSPKFTAEHDLGFLKRAIARHDISHPVIQDRDFILWRQYAVRAWPTLIFIDPEGYIIGQHSGEPDADKLITGLGKLVAAAKNAGHTPFEPIGVTAMPDHAGQLKFPGKIIALPSHFSPFRWAISDSGHHRIVLTDDRGRILETIGGEEAGHKDGTLSSAAFRQPQGLAAAPDNNGKYLYIADTGNHAIRRIDLAAGTVETVAGIGRRGRILSGEPVLAEETALASPWDLVFWQDRLLFANAGTHQIGLYDPGNGSVCALVGSGHEALRDGPGLDAALAQPSGLSVTPDGSSLFIADSEASALRHVELRDPFTVRTLIGRGLFEFGRDGGSLQEAKLQHPLGVHYVTLADHKGVVVADSYNHAIRFLDIKAAELQEFDDGYVCSDHVCIPLDEPSGVAFDGRNRVLVADTNNHRIYGYDLKERRAFTWLQ